MIFVILLGVLISAGLLLAYRIHVRDSRGHPLPPRLPFHLPIIGHTHLLLGDNKDVWELIKLAGLQTNRLGGVSVGHVGGEIYYGEIWKRHRKVMTPAFSVPVIHGFLDIFNSKSKKFVKKMEPFSGKGPVDIFKPLRQISLETFYRTSFGLDGGDEDLIEKYMEAADYILMNATRRFYCFYLQSDLIYKLSGLQKKEMAAIKVLKTMSAEFPISGRYKPLLDLLLSMDNKLTDEEIGQEIDTAIAAGFDTTPILIVYTAIFLGSYPKVQEKLYEEFIQVLGPDRDVEKDDVNKLVYTEAVLKESLRLISVGPALLRCVNEDVKLKNYTMRAGSQCVLLPAGSHRHPVWGPDSDSFRPERWLDASTVPANAFGGFSWGKRSCLGKTYALTTMKVSLAHFLRRYRIKSDITQLQLKLDFILKPESNHEVSIEKRY